MNLILASQMKMLTKNAAATFANPMRDTAGDKVVKIFNPTGAGTWYISEAEAIDGDVRLFGLITLGNGAEYGYVLLSELKSVRGRFGLGLERDLHFSGTLADAASLEAA